MDTSPHRSDFVRVNGIRLHYLDWGGSGTVLLFLAGMGSNAHLFDQFAPRFTDKFHTLALTRRGHGESEYPETGYDIDTLTEDIRLFLDYLHVGPAILVQHSNEGIELSHFAALYPERVLKLVFLDPAYDRNSPEFKALDEKWPTMDIEYPAENGVYDNFSDFVYHRNKNYPTNATSWCDAREEDLRHQTKLNQEGKVVYKVTASIRKAITETMFAYTPEYDQIRAPVLSIFPIRGNTYYVTAFMTEEQQAQMMEFYDAVQFPWMRHCIEQFRLAVPQAKIVELPDSHTYCFITQEELVCDEMRRFLLDD
ncbi:MAG TPA: alpha/beta hydrolase [Anaerolineales bacterium]|nr:alpha/beta hydrolase [Anaerolineales bacterium]